ncbi:MAG: phospholipase A2 [Actinomycetota bacterium]
MLHRVVAHVIAITVAVITPISSATADSPIPNRAVIDQLVFHTPLAEFRRERTRARRLHRWLIVTTDGCSAPLVGSKGRSFDFRLACERHDLAYANYSALSRLGFGVKWDADLRVKVDDQFQHDLQQSCVRRRHSERLRCDSWAVIYFHSVRVAAGP